MQESLGGNSKTAVVATVTPSACSAGETYCTLAFAAGAKKIKCRAVVNEDQMRRDSLNEEIIQALREENVRLRAELDESRVEAELAESMRSSVELTKDHHEKVETLERELEQIRMLFDQNSAVRVCSGACDFFPPARPRMALNRPLIASHSLFTPMTTGHWDVASGAIVHPAGARGEQGDGAACHARG